MKNKDLTNEIAKAMGRDSKEVTKLLEAFMNVMCETLSSNTSMQLPALGTFSTELEEEKIINNNGVDSLIPPRIVTTFQASSTLLKQIKS